MTYKENVTAILECNFAGFKQEIIDTAVDCIMALSVEPCRDADDYENEIADLHNRLDIAEYDKERYKEEITTLEAENKGEWIPVSERLPDIHNYTQLYLVTYKHGQICTAFFTEANGKCWWSIDDVEAWQPLPEPYKKGGEE